MRKPFPGVSLDHIARVIVLIVADMVLITLAYIIATWLPFSGEGSQYLFPFYVNGRIAFSYLQLITFTVVYISSFAVFRMYGRTWLDGLNAENIYILAAVGVGTGAIFAANVLFGNEYKLSLFLAGIILLPLLFPPKKIMIIVIMNTGNNNFNVCFILKFLIVLNFFFYLTRIILFVSENPDVFNL